VTKVEKTQCLDARLYEDSMDNYFELVYNNNIGCYSMKFNGDGTASFDILAWLSAPVYFEEFVASVTPDQPFPTGEFAVKIPSYYKTIAEVYSLFTKMVDSKGCLR
jgi:hypothetical protein